MKHSEIYTKFMILYDKEETMSSYPPLTDYEIATLLNKAYLALIAQKLTGNNPRQVGFEADIKAIEDIRPLIITQSLTSIESQQVTASNEIQYNTPDNPKMLYYIQSSLQTNDNKESIDGKNHNMIPTFLISHDDSEKFKNSNYNLPWIKNPVVYLERDVLHVLYDSYKIKNPGNLIITYIKEPIKFEKDENNNSDNQVFELNDSMAEELINLAIILSAEIVQSPRFTSKLQSRPLES